MGRAETLLPIQGTFPSPLPQIMRVDFGKRERQPNGNFFFTTIIPTIPIVEAQEERLTLRIPAEAFRQPGEFSLKITNTLADCAVFLKLYVRPLLPDIERLYNVANNSLNGAPVNIGFPPYTANIRAVPTGQTYSVYVEGRNLVAGSTRYYVERYGGNPSQLICRPDITDGWERLSAMDILPETGVTVPNATNPYTQISIVNLPTIVVRNIPQWPTVPGQYRLVAENPPLIPTDGAGNPLPNQAFTGGKSVLCFTIPATMTNSEVVASGSAVEQHSVDTRLNVRISPSPVSHTATLLYELPDDATVTIEVLNTLQQHAQASLSLQQSAGTHEHPIDCTALASGVYHLRVTATYRHGHVSVAHKHIIIQR